MFQFRNEEIVPTIYQEHVEAYCTVPFHLRLWDPSFKEALDTCTEWLLEGRESPARNGDNKSFDQLYLTISDIRQQTGHQCIEWQQGNSQTLEHVRAEMVTVASTYLVNNFFTKKLMFLRWKVADAISTYLYHRGIKNDYCMQLHNDYRMTKVDN